MEFVVPFGLFLLSVAILFTVLAAFCRTRRFAILVPTPILTFIPAVWVCATLFHHRFPVPLWEKGAPFFMGFLVSIAAAVLVQWVLASSHHLLVRILVFSVALFSFWDILLSISIGLDGYFLADRSIFDPSSIAGKLSLASIRRGGCILPIKESK